MEQLFDSNTFSVMVGGVEVNDHHLNEHDAEAIADEWRSDGYDDVIVVSDSKAESPIDQVGCLNCETGPFIDTDKCPKCQCSHALVWADEWPNVFPVLPYNGTSGWSGSDTSRARAALQDSNGTTTARQRMVLAHLEDAGRVGMTWQEASQITGLHHGAISGVLSVLHKQGIICRLKDTRNRCQVYVMPQHVNGSEQAPYKPNSSSARMLDLIATVGDHLASEQYEQAKHCIEEFLSEWQGR